MKRVMFVLAVCCFAGEALGSIEIFQVHNQATVRGINATDYFASSNVLDGTPVTISTFDASAGTATITSALSGATISVSSVASTTQSGPFPTAAGTGFELRFMVSAPITGFAITFDGGGYDITEFKLGLQTDPGPFIDWTASNSTSVDLVAGEYKLNASWGASSDAGDTGLLTLEFPEVPTVIPPVETVPEFSSLATWSLLGVATVLGLRLSGFRRRHQATPTAPSR